MQIIKSIMLLLLIICSATVSAQLIHIKGTVSDEKGVGLPAVTISLLNEKDSVVVLKSLSTQTGRFDLICPSPGNFILKYESVGYTNSYSAPFTIKDGSSIYEVLPANMSVNTYNLNVVVVRSTKPQVQVTPDRMVLNVQNSISATGSNVLELLQKSPGIQVDDNDHITFKGKAGVKIYIDGKISQLGSDDLAAYLKGMNSVDVDAIEIINNPGAQYDASGNAGVINIKLKKNRNVGTNGSITLGLTQGKTPKGNNALSLNYRNKKVNVFSNVGLNFGKNETDIHAPRLLKDTLYDQTLKILSTTENYNIKAGVDYFIDGKQTLGVMNTSSISTEQYRSFGTTDIAYQPTNTYTKTLIATNVIPKKRVNQNFNLNYRYVDSSGREVNFDADYGLFRGEANSVQDNRYFNSANPLMSQIITQNNTPTNIDIYTAKFDVYLPVGKGKLSYGGKFSHVTTGNTFDFYNVLNGNSVKENSNSYNFDYRENVSAAYVNYKHEFNSKVSLAAGLRTEATHSEGTLNRADGISPADSRVIRSYFDFFPNIGLTMVMNTYNTFNLFYNRRIDRPGYQDLNPFETKLDQLSYVKGNPFLRPQYTNNIELVHTWRNKINTSVGFSHVKDFATQTTDTLNNYTYLQQRNLASQNIATASIGLPVTISNWWQGYVNLWFNYQWFKGQFSNTAVNIKVPGYGAFTQQTFTLGNGYAADLSAWYKGPSALRPTFTAQAQGAIDIGLQKVFMEKRATLKIIATDIFRTSVPLRAKSDFGGLLINLSVVRETQTARVSFTYRFGSTRIKESRKRETASESEAKRVKEN